MKVVLCTNMECTAFVGAGSGQPNSTQLSHGSQNFPTKTSVHRARTLCDCESLCDKLKCLRATFRQNGCSNWQIQQGVNLLERVIPNPGETYFSCLPPLSP
ncbi:hypothetical protein L798_13063 [Zootermopsis nevadensis]|uniref:Uncharacterized protein n=1 Tax=Zootermopsis nevadensis TaxID=136037 RepID=A0A067QSV1_ZOONE|nr:hypothetical protein L798_13063 [Zootermopsis nevadensis]